MGSFLSAEKDFEEGDLVEISRGIYSHWAVYSGDGNAIHLTGIAGPSNSDSNASHLFYVSGVSFAKAAVIEEPLSSIKGYSTARKNNRLFWRSDPFPGNEIVQRARSQIGPVEYNILWNNCEHFAKWCRYGLKISDQVTDLFNYICHRMFTWQWTTSNGSQPLLE